MRTDANERSYQSATKWALLLIWLIPISKINFKSFLPFLPSEFFGLIFQGGLHPYLNFIFVLIGSIVLQFSRGRSYQIKSTYRAFLVVLSFVLVAQSSFQIALSEVSIGGTLSTLMAALLLIWVYGVRVPEILGVERIIKALFYSACLGVFLSLVVYFINPLAAWKGGRFIGAFKHIPHMVTCSMVAFVFGFDHVKHKILSLIVVPLSFYFLLLTGTRSSLLAAVFAAVLYFLFKKVQSIPGQIIKISFAILISTYVLFFGSLTVEYLEKLAKGEAAIMEREAQDGVESRWDEFQRGWESFQQAPWLGHGLASKFSKGQDASVESYDASKDPHNYFMSAGSIGGWPLLLVMSLILIYWVINILKNISNKNLQIQMVSFYLAAHLPILLIYHLHFSPGGYADRVYWLLFALLFI